MQGKDDETRLKRLKTIVDRLPEKPGVYQYLDDKGTIIYVGKAKNLKRRVSSYFNRNQENLKTRLLVSHINDIKPLVVNSDNEALLTENQLIKRYKPHYNILLKDDKTYPSICVSNEYLPRVFKTRHIVKRAGTYFGPYGHISTMYALLDLINKLYHPRPCRKAITKEGIEAGKYKVCLEFHINNCKAPCVGKQSHADYLEKINDAKEILKGNTKEISEHLMSEMRRLADEMRFEEAQELKRQYLLIEDYRGKTAVVSQTIGSVDVYYMERDEDNAYVNYFHVHNGAINQGFTFELKLRADETDSDILETAIGIMRERYGSDAREIIVPFIPEWEMDGITFTVPQRGDKHKLLELSKLNVKQYRFDRLKQADKLNPEQKQVRLMTEIQKKLHLPKLPYRVELFDNSNISGTDAVAGCVVFVKLKPAKKEYRTYNIKTVVGPDDYASMREVVYRRYKRAIDESQPLPDLIITDGGKGQMDVVREVVEDQLHLSIPIAGLAKDSHHRTNELLYGFPPVVIGMKTDSELFRLLTRMQDEVHRFAITFHRKKRSKHQLASGLDDVPGIGPKRKKQLLRRFGSVKRIKEATMAELQETVGTKNGEQLYNYLHRNADEKAE